MKKLALATAVVAIVSTSVFADDGKINFTGLITDDACTVVNHMANPLTVALGTVSSKAFTGAGSTAAPTRFEIDLTNCPATAKTAKVKFDGIADSGNTDILALTDEAGVATGVGIQLSDLSNAVIPLFTASKSFDLTVGDNSLPFIARYYATNDSVTPGVANSTSNFTIVYN